MDIAFGTITVTLQDAALVTFPPGVGPPVPGAGLSDAPVDGHTYARKDGAWIQLGSGDGGGLTVDDADARYLRIEQLNTPNGPAGLDADTLLSESQLPLPPTDLSIWFANRLA